MSDRTLDRTNKADDKLEEIKLDIEETKHIMTQNIDKVIKRGEDLKELEKQSEDLKIEADAFKIKTKKMSCQMWLEKFRSNILIASGVLLAIIIIILIIYFSGKH